MTLANRLGIPMNNYITLLSAALLTCAVSTFSFAETEVEGEVSGVWNTEGSPYIAIGDLVLSEDDSLRIEAGVEVLFEDESRFTVNGYFSAEGSEDDSILFAPGEEFEHWGGFSFISSDTNSQLSYCVIRDGSATEEGNISQWNSGGNIYLEQTKLTVTHSRISSGLARRVGGGVCINRANPIFRDCIFSENQVYNHDDPPGAGGGALSAQFSSGIEITGCVFEVNTSVSSGGAVWLWASDATIKDCGFIENQAVSNGGAIAMFNASSPSIIQSSFRENDASAGGAIYINGENTEPLIEWCTFYANVTVHGDRVGGAIYVRALASPELRYCVFIENDAHYGGAIYFKEPPRSKVHHCLFIRNGALRAGGALGTSDDFEEATQKINNCTFFANRGTGLEPYATAAHAREGASLHLSSCIVWGEGPHFGEDGPVTVTYSHVRNGEDGEGNSDENPGFFELDSSLFLLKGDSPCVDSGNEDLPLDPDSTRNDRGWAHFPQDAAEGLQQDTLSSELTTIDRTTVTLTYINETGVPVYVDVRDSWTQEFLFEPVDITTVLSDSLLTAAAWTADGYVISGGNNGEDPNYIYLLDEDFEPVDQFEQPGGEEDPYLDLANDGGSVLYGGMGNRIFEFTTDGEAGERFDMPDDVDILTGFTIDSRNAYNFMDFYLGTPEGTIVRADGDMWERQRWDINESIVAMAVKENTRALYVATEPDSGRIILNQVKPDGAATVPLYTMNIPDGYRLGGFEVTQGLEAGRGVLIGVLQGDPQWGTDVDYLIAVDLYVSWLVVEPEGKLLLPGEEAEWEIVFAGDQMPEGVYDDSFDFIVNGWGEGNNVQAHMDLEQSDVNGGVRHVGLPRSVRLFPTYPNPFNGITTFKFFLSTPADYRLTLVDISGRIVKQIEGGHRGAGIHHGVIDGGSLASGYYLLHLSTSSGNSRIPLTVVK